FLQHLRRHLHCHQYRRHHDELSRPSRGDQRAGVLLPCAAGAVRTAILTFGFGFALVQANVAGATTFFASNAASISAAAAGPGDSIVMLTNGVWNDASISFKKLGTLANPITLKAQVQGRVLLTGNSRLFIGGTNLVVDGLVFTNGSTSQSSDIIAFRTSSSSLAKNCRLTDTSLIELNPSSDSTDYKWVSLYGTSNRVDHC